MEKMVNLRHGPRGNRNHNIPLFHYPNIPKPKSQSSVFSVSLRLIRFLMVLLFLVPSVVHADMRDVLLKFHPYITAQEEYNDNINLSARNRIDDYITTIYPGLRFSSSKQNYGIDLDYLLGAVFYAKESDNNYVSHAGTLNFWHLFAQRWTFRVREYLVRSEEPREREFTAGALPEQLLLGTQRDRSVYFRNVFEPSLEYQFGRESRLGLSYRNNIYDNKSRFAEDSQENFIGSTLTHQFNVRNGISFNYGFSRGSFDRSPDFTLHSAGGRYIHRFSQRTSIYGDYFFERRDFESTGLLDQTSIDYDVHRPSLGIDHAFNPTLSGGAQMGYFWQNPARGSSTSGYFYNVILAQRVEKTTYTLAFQGGYTEDFFTAQNLGFTKYHRLIGTVAHRLRERVNVGGYSSYERATSEPDTKDRIFGIGVNGSYQILRWLTAGLDVSHRENHAKDDDLDYSEYRAIFRITATY